LPPRPVVLQRQVERLDGDVLDSPQRRRLEGAVDGSDDLGRFRRRCGAGAFLPEGHVQTAVGQPPQRDLGAVDRQAARLQPAAKHLLGLQRGAQIGKHRDLAPIGGEKLHFPEAHMRHETAVHHQFQPPHLRRDHALQRRVRARLDPGHHPARRGNDMAGQAEHDVEQDQHGHERDAEPQPGVAPVLRRRGGPARPLDRLRHPLPFAAAADMLRARRGLPLSLPGPQ